MIKNLLILSILFLNFYSWAQNSIEYDKDIKPLNEKIKALQSENSKLKNQISNLESHLIDNKSAIDSLRIQTNSNTGAIVQTSEQLGIKIKETGDKNEGKITEISESLSKNSLYGIISVLLVVLISGLLYWLLSNRQRKDKNDVTDMFNNTRENLIEQIKENSNTIGVDFLRELHEYSDLVKLQLQSNQSSTDSKEPDHSLALKVASEINLIERNISLMDIKTKGLKQLQASVGKLKDNLAANGYEMPELLGKQFHEGMKVIVASSIQDENLDKGSEIITKVIIPQVNYNDKMIQSAQIETSKGY